jgi:hypothetical protein
LVGELQRLKKEELKLLGWTAKRELSKLNYHIHTDAVKQNLIPQELLPAQTTIVYTNEADVLNIAIPINESPNTSSTTRPNGWMIHF